MGYFNNYKYDEKTKRLFLTYLIPIGEVMPEYVMGMKNTKRWALHNASLKKNMATGIGKPGVLKPKKDANNPLELEQPGRFIHPTLPPYMKDGVWHHPTFDDQSDYQENWAISRAVDIQENQTRPTLYKLDIEITDPTAKRLWLTDPEYRNKFPLYISPQIGEELSVQQDQMALTNWQINHWAFIDVPAFGEMTRLAGSCYGTANECGIKPRNASVNGAYCKCNGVETNLKALLHNASANGNSSSDNLKQNTEISMNEEVNQGYKPDSSEELSKILRDKRNLDERKPEEQTKAKAKEEVKAHETGEEHEHEDGDPNKPVKKKPESKSEEDKEEEIEIPKATNIDEANKIIENYAKTAHALKKGYDGLKGEVESQKQVLEEMAIYKRRAQLAVLIDRRSPKFKSDKEWIAEIEKVSKWQNVSDEDIAEIYSRPMEVKANNASVSNSEEQETHREVPSKFKNASATVGSSDSVERDPFYLQKLVTGEY